MMFMNAIVTFAVAFAHLASAHFQIRYPPWRADSLESSAYSQWDYPCAGVPYNVGNRTDWPLNGGAVALKLQHPWTYLYINLGFGDGNNTNFNMSLVPGLLNVTGRGLFCLPSLNVPTDVSDGTNATIQVVTNGDSGSALYNCADITFQSAASVPDGTCTNDTTVSAVLVGQSPLNATVTVQASAPTATTTSNSASTMPAGGMAFFAAAGLACVFATGLGL